MDYDVLSRWDPQVTVRLQVWHFNDRGRCPEFNHALAGLFSPRVPSLWIVRPSQVVEPDGISCRDDYVPVEVDFEHEFATYKNPLANPQSGVRDLFKKFAPAIVYEYFITKLQSLPHAMNIYAIERGEEMTDPDIKRQYAHVFFFIPLEVQLRRFVKPEMVSQEDKLMEILRAGVDSLPILQALICTFVSFQGGDISSITGLLATTKETLTKLTSQLPWLKDIIEELDKAAERTQTPTKSGLVPLQEAVNSFQQLRNLAGHLQPRIALLSRGESLTNQGVVDTILDLRQATIHLSEYEQWIQKVNDEETEKFYCAEKKHRRRGHKATAVSVVTGLAAILAAVICRNPQALAVVLADLAPAGVAFLEYSESRKALAAAENLKARANDMGTALVSVKMALQHAQTDLATIYISKVMRQPIQDHCMGRHELEKAVKMLGGDLTSLGEGLYDQVLMADRLKHLVEVGLDLDAKYNRTLESLGVVLDGIGRLE